MTRSLTIFLAALIALAGGVLGALATQQQRDYALRGYVDAAQSAELPYRIPRRGVNADLRQYGPAELRQHLAWMEAAHITWVRQFMRMPEDGALDLVTWDDIFNALIDYPKLRPVIVLTADAPPDDPATFAAFARDVAERYGDQIDAYQIWDEPNLDDAWGGRDPRPAEYAALLSASYEAIHAVDASATVIAAALAPTTEDGPENLNEMAYLRALYALGAGDFMDAIAAKPYGFDASPNDRRVDANALNFSRIIALREIMRAHGDAAKHLWASHYGWNHLPESWTGAPSIWGQVSAPEQISYTLNAQRRARLEWPWLGGLILHHWQPNAPPDDPQWGFAVIQQNGQPGPLWDALVAEAPPPHASNGLYHPITGHASYSGVWTFGPLGADIGWLETTDSQLSFTFTGRDLSLLLREGDYVAFLYPTIDGQPANATPHDNQGNAYIFLRSDSAEPETHLVPVARDLDNETHTLRVIADRGWDQWALAGYAVGSGDLTQAYDDQIALAWLTAVLALMAVVLSGRSVPWRRVLRPVNGALSRLDALSAFLISAATSVALMLSLLLTFGEGAPGVFRRETVQLGLAIVTAGVVTLNPALLVTLAALLLLFVLIVQRLEIGLILTVFYAPFFLFPVELYTFFFPMAELLLLLTAAAWLVRLLADWGRARQTSISAYPARPLAILAARCNALDAAVLAWVGLGLLSLAWTERLDVAFTEWRVMLVEPALFYVILRSLGARRDVWLKLADALVMAGAVVAVVGLALFVTGEAVITAEGGARRLASVYGSPNNVALFLGRALPFALAYLLLPLDSRRRVFGALSALAMLLAVALTQSAGAYLLGMPAVFALALLLIWGRRALAPLAGLATLGALGLAALTRISARFAGLLDFTQGTNFFRLRVWESAIEIIRDRPLTGLGLDQFLYVFRGQYIRPDAIWDRDLSHPHNWLLDFWTRLGLGGVLIFAWMQVAFWSRALKAYRAHRHAPLTFALVVGTIASMGHLLAHGLIDNSVYVNDLALIFALQLGLMQGLSASPMLSPPHQGVGSAKHESQSQQGDD